MMTGINALITGGDGELGTVVVKAFLAAGAKVATSYRREQSKVQPRRLKSVLRIEADVTDERQVKVLFRKVRKQFGGLDILINLVGGYIPSHKISEVSLEDWDRMMSLNLKSVFLCSREFLSHLSHRAYGRIISMSAMPALIPSAGRGPYAVSKSGIVILTKVLGEELKGSGITCNAIAPSIIITKANIQAMPREDANKWVPPEQIAATMLYLCSREAISINGLTIPMFGGV